jgi:hypothetical protein
MAIKIRMELTTSADTQAASFSALLDELQHVAFQHGVSLRVSNRMSRRRPKKT